MISLAMSKSWPARQAFSRMLESRMCSRLRTGSASMPTSPSKRRNGALDPVTQDLRFGVPVEVRRLEAGQDAHRQPRLGAGGVDGEVGRVFERLDAVGAFFPARQPVAPVGGGLDGEIVHRHPLARGVVGVDPGLEILGPQVGEGEQQVGDVAFGVDDDRGHPIERGLFEQIDAEAGLAAAGHADTDRMGGQVARVVVYLDVLQLSWLPGHILCPGRSCRVFR